MIPFAALLQVGWACLQIPVDNPISTHYSGEEGYPAWTDSIRWDRVIDMSRYPKGKNAFEKFESARDELAAAGGGVLYYPAGDYDFSDMPADGPRGRGLMLRSGIILRGDAPRGNRQATRGELDLPTRFVFGFQKRTLTEGEARREVSVPRDWNLIGLAPEPEARLRDVSHVGVVWIRLVGAVVYLGPDLVWGPSWKESRGLKSDYAKPAWADRVPDGTHPYDPLLGALPSSGGGGLAGAGRNRLVFGCVLERSALLNDFETCGRKEAPEGFGPDGFHMAKFAARIGVYGSRILVANNRLPMAREGSFRYEQTTVETFPRKGNDFAIGKPRRSVVLWDYGRVEGIDVNKGKFSAVREAVLKEGRGGYWEEGVAVLDNWVWNHGHRGFNVGGQWVTLRGNRNERLFLKGGGDVYGLGGGWRLTLDGFIESSPGGGGMISDNLARAFDLAGRNLWAGSNSFNNTGSSPGNDGEGILCQSWGGTDLHSWALTRNRDDGSIGGGGKGFMGGFAVNCIGLLAAWNETPGYVGTLWRPPLRLADVAVVGNTCGSVLPRDSKVDPVAAGAGIPLYESRGGNLRPPREVKTELYDGDAVKVTWADASTNEIGFRVDRQVAGGPWTAVAYRPPQIEADPLNAPAWVDFLAPRGKALKYRVVAIDGRDDDSGAGAPGGALTLPPISR